MKIKIIDFGGVLPTRAHYNDAGADVYIKHDVVLDPWQSMAIPLGFGIVLPDGYMGTINPRSSTSKKGLITNLAPIDSGYRGEIHALVTNTTSETVHLDKDMRVGQLVITPIILPTYVLELGEERGENGFGSSGT